MEKKQIRPLLLLTIVAAVALILLVGLTVHSVKDRVTQTSFDRLDATSRQLASEFLNKVAMDRAVLEAVASMIANEDEPDNERLCEMLSNYMPDSSYISYVELLRPDGTILDADGAVRDVSGSFNFNTEARKGAYISDIERSTHDGETRVVRNAVPVVDDGKTIGILYGVIRLSELSEKYKTNIYDGHAYVLIVDGNTGNFIMDTWHKSLGSISDLGQRKTIPGYSMDKVDENLKNGVAGNVGFVSKTTGGVLYMHHEPMGVNNWSVIVVVEQEYAMVDSSVTSNTLYLMAGGIALVVLLYIAYVLWNVSRASRRVKQQASEDPVTLLPNRRAYDKYIAENRQTVYQSLTCVCVKVNDLFSINKESGHAAGDKALRETANRLRQRLPGYSVYHIGEGEFVALLEGDGAGCGDSMAELSRELEARSCCVSYGIASRERETGPQRVIAEAEELMLEHKYHYYEEHDRRAGK